ncbi:N-acetylmuramic acid 6-phosphate etherase [Paramaledivibacter caminithermalis]|jgi:N-acetylmuramic acid 6-phosphate etherase|uniref:N-acetylmuramic acid 6-phosphate etherase n=1 Tax=Paramaledivibacter caminithermalis (strain DSM 15212 / CIP 107654 / DViRD3) TaxID=1121301 RepID=A0A1M6T6D6_PARC5|nr:N-acetylmuramic acid 6-phosphate etherase [Paramaledivibacter caminithermalis]SHK52622.1 N-acetylmuramic acid 6-phosphate etherase [Paramaledivibacter caminithermalis DSM 15212]
MAVAIEHLTTEMPNNKTIDIDEKSPIEIIKLMNEEDKKVALAVEKESHNIALAVAKIIEAFKIGGRLIYIGAGTSGRLGILDAAECPPTFGTSKEQVIGIIAGGDKALIDAIEGAEDNFDEGEKDLKAINISNKDVVVGIAASGRTPYVLGALEYAKKIGAITVSLCCNHNGKINDLADISITPVVGPEILTGSTRLKAGTAQKMVLNMLSTASMIGIGKVYKNLMIDVQPTNQKLIERTKRIIMMATGVTYEEAEKKLIKAQYNPKAAVVMIKAGCSYQEALVRIDNANGFVNKALEK